MDSVVIDKATAHRLTATAFQMLMKAFHQFLITQGNARELNVSKLGDAAEDAAKSAMEHLNKFLISPSSYTGDISKTLISFSKAVDGEEKAVRGCANLINA